MSSLSTLSIVEGSQGKRFRKGRGRGTGNGKTAGKGMKGQGAHSHTKANGYEGGQTPIARRLPKFGARKTHANSPVEYAIVNLEKLNAFEEGTTINLTLLLDKKVIKEAKSGLKVLGRGKLTKKLNLEVAAISASAKAAIEELGGTVTLVK